MGGCRCSYKSCKSATKTTENLHFFHYPVKHSERCAIWIKNADKPEFVHLPNDQLRNKVICGLHFEDKYFTNVQKKRLVHDAVPTLDEGCEDEPFNKEVEVFPTSVDGSSFILQADHLQPGPSRNDHKLGFRNGKMIIHKFEQTESEVYTIDPSYIQQSFYYPNNSKDVFINNTTYQDDQAIVYKSSTKSEDDDSMLFESSDNSIFKTPESEDAYITPDQSMKSLNNLFFDEPEEELVKDNMEEDPQPEIKTEKSPKKKTVNKNVLKRINIHAQEIASIKRSLAQTNVKLPRKNIIRMLKGKVPDSLLGALSLHLNKTGRKRSLNSEEKAFLHAMYTVSPTAYQVLRGFGWFIPQHIVIDRAANDSNL